MLSSEQLRAARAILRWDQARLATASGISIETVKRLEKVDGVLSATRVSTVDALQRALEAAGVEFIPENGGGAGVRLRKPGAPHARSSTDDVIAQGATFLDRNTGTVEAVRSAQRKAEAQSSFKPAGPATDAIERMEAEIAADRGKGRKG